MIPAKGKVLLRFEAKKTNLTIVGADGKENPQKLEGNFYIETTGRDCEQELKKGSKVTLREHYYGIPIEIDKENTKNNIYHLIVDQSDVWGIE